MFGSRPLESSGWTGPNGGVSPSCGAGFCLGNDMLGVCWYDVFIWFEYNWGFTRTRRPD